MFEFFFSLGSMAKSRYGFAMVWNVVVFPIYRVHSDGVFNGALTTVKEVEEKSFFYLKMVYL